MYLVVCVSVVELYYTLESCINVYDYIYWL